MRETSARIWIGTFGPVAPTGLVLRYRSPTGPEQSRALGNSWSSAGTGPTTVRHQRVTLSLASGTLYRLALVQGTRVLARAEVETLPAELPVSGRPFSVLLGSCFHRLSDPGCTVGKAYAGLYGDPDRRPHLKFLAGDQVYLDAPWQDFLPTPAQPLKSEIWLRTRFFETYRQTWCQGGNGKGFHWLLRHGANFFCSDDHEFWNNFPNPASFIPELHYPASRSRWKAISRPLYQAVQTDRPVECFSVGGLSFFVADTRIDRTASIARFMSHASLAKLTSWARSLRGPGVLVLGQPLLDEPSRLLGNLTDFHLADYAQYADLAKALFEANHDIVLLTGDVHFGRVASAPLNAAGNRRLIEVVSSPMSLVDALAEARWRLGVDQNPKLFPVIPLGGMPRRRITYHHAVAGSGSRTHEHFMTIAFRRSSASSGEISMQVEAWLVRQDPPAGSSLPRRDGWSFTRTLR